MSAKFCNFTLFHRVCKQRTAYDRFQQGNHFQIPQERIDELESLGFNWDFHKSNWMQRYTELQEYRTDHGDACVPQNYLLNLPLGRWVETQRRLYKVMKNGRPSQMTPERIKLLEAEEFVWDAAEAAWAERYHELCEYKAYNGHLRVPRRSSTGLGNWVYQQHFQYRRLQEGKRVALSEKRKSALERLGVKWS